MEVKCLHIRSTKIRLNAKEEIYLFQVKYVLPEALLVCQFESWGIDFVRFLQDVFKPATEWFSQAIVTGYFRFLRMGFFLYKPSSASVLYGNLAIREEEKKLHPNSAKIVLNSLFLAQYESDYDTRPWSWYGAVYKYLYFEYGRPLFNPRKDFEFCKWSFCLVKCDFTIENIYACIKWWDEHDMELVNLFVFKLRYSLEFLFDGSIVFVLQKWVEILNVGKWCNEILQQLTVFRSNLIVQKRRGSGSRQEPVDQGVGRCISFLAPRDNFQKSFVTASSNSIQRRLNGAGVKVHRLFHMVMNSGTVGAARVFKNTNELLDHVLHSRRWSFSGDLGSLVWLLKCGFFSGLTILCKESVKVVTDKQEGDSCVLARLLGPQSVFRIPQMLKMAALLRWKLKLVSTGWWSVGNDSLVLQPEVGKKDAFLFISANKEGDETILRIMGYVHVLMKLTVGIELEVMKILARALLILSLHLVITILFRVPRIFIMHLKENMMLIEKLEAVHLMGEQPSGIPGMRKIKIFVAAVVQKNNGGDYMVLNNPFCTSLWSKEKSGGTIWLRVELPGAPGYMRNCRLLFDRGKLLESIPTFFLSVVHHCYFSLSIHNCGYVKVFGQLPCQFVRVQEMVEKLYHLIQAKIENDVAIRTDMNTNRVEDSILIEPVLLEDANTRELGSLVVGFCYNEEERNISPHALAETGKHDNRGSIKKNVLISSVVWSCHGSLSSTQANFLSHILEGKDNLKGWVFVTSHEVVMGTHWLRAPLVVDSAL
ncbi:uncharacterized protein LOC113300047 isoform X2 [Papaver somniferum]|nr:uncharacterized protein LOC113300047 isoform X2 [Papaver somniferum]